MAKHSQKRRTRRAMGQKGGDLAGNPASAWGWIGGTVGNGWTQFMNSLTLQPGANLGSAQSNAIVPVGNVNAQNSQPGIGPNLTGAVPQSGGKRRRGRRSVKRGGDIGAVISQAAVPGILLVAQNMYGSKTRKHRASRRHRRH